MHRLLIAPLLLAVALPLAGCGGSTEAVTDPTQLTPLTEEQKQQLREADQQLIADEHPTPILPKKAGAAPKK
jgi:hypothetical protein